MFSRGNATSGAPICSGMIALANPANSGVANSSSMIVPCIVNSWLYCSGLSTICRPGANSSARISSAIRPPSRKKMNEVMKYRLPITLWSVVVIHLTTVLARAVLGAPVASPEHSSVDALGGRRGGHQLLPAAVRTSLLAPRAAAGSRLRSMGSWPVWPAAFSRAMCASYSACETTLTLKSICEW